MKIVINIPPFKMKVRPWFDKIVQSLVEESEEQPDDALKKPEESLVMQAPQKEPMLKNTPKPETENLFIPKRKQVGQKAAKIQLQIEDLHLISTALIRYKKHLSQNKQLDKAHRVGELDQMFYEVIAQKSAENNLSRTKPKSNRERAAQMG